MTAGLLRTARCHCGQLVLECQGEPRRISMCHCLDCQRRTGSAFSVAVFYERASVRIAAGVPRSFERPSASGFPVRFCFCDTCGANIFWEPSRRPHITGVAAGAFADQAVPVPEQSVFTGHKLPWVRLPAGMPAFDVVPPPRPGDR